MEDDLMPKLTLTDFDFDGGRGEPARLALSIAGIAFEDRRVTFDTWRSLKSQMPYGALPVLEVDGHALSQSNAINRYVGKLANRYPADAWQARSSCPVVRALLFDVATKLAINHLRRAQGPRRRLVGGE
jgi:prostaglandin-H2 D-isomerase / glutathione transferase